MKTRPLVRASQDAGRPATLVVWAELVLLNVRNNFRFFVIQVVVNLLGYKNCSAVGLFFTTCKMDYGALYISQKVRHKMKAIHIL